MYQQHLYKILENANKLLVTIQSKAFGSFSGTFG